MYLYIPHLLPRTCYILDLSFTGADVNANDGVYTAYFVDYSGDGAYSVEVMAKSDGNAVVQRSGAVGAYPIGAALAGRKKE